MVDLVLLGEERLNEWRERGGRAQIRHLAYYPPSYGQKVASSDLPQAAPFP
jgi:hypothetical protein